MCNQTKVKGFMVLSLFNETAVFPLLAVLGYRFAKIVTVEWFSYERCLIPGAFTLLIFLMH